VYPPPRSQANIVNDIWSFPSISLVVPDSRLPWQLLMLFHIYLLHASTGEAATMLTEESDDLGRPLRSPTAVWRRTPFLSPLSLGGRAVISLGWIKLQRSPNEQLSGSLLAVGSKVDEKKTTSESMSEETKPQVLEMVMSSRLVQAGVQLPKSSHPGRAKYLFVVVLAQVHVLSVHAAHMHIISVSSFPISL
jgi:hypothetical protein